MAKKKKTTPDKVMGNFYSPYRDEHGYDADAWYEAFKNDPHAHIFKEGLRYCRIMERCEYYLKAEPTLMVFVDLGEPLRIGDVLVDELDNEYAISGFAHIRFTGAPPEWYPRIAPMLITGQTYNMGEYLRKKLTEQEKVKRIIEECCNDILFQYNGKASGVVSEVSNSVPTYQVWYGDDAKEFTSVDELMESPFFGGLALNDLIGKVDIRYI